MRGYEKGSVISFVVVGLLLTLATVGVLYGVRHYTSVSQTAEPAVSLPTDRAATKGDNNKTSEATKPSDTTTPSSQNNAAQGSNPASKPQTQTATEIPKTGPTETVGTILVAGLLAGTTVAYIRSRRQASSL